MSKNSDMKEAALKFAILAKKVLEKVRVTQSSEIREINMFV